MPCLVLALRVLTLSVTDLGLADFGVAESRVAGLGAPLGRLGIIDLGIAQLWSCRSECHRGHADLGVAGL